MGKGFGNDDLEKAYLKWNKGNPKNDDGDDRNHGIDHGKKRK
jgi:hypothetical protein